MTRSRIRDVGAARRPQREAAHEASRREPWSVARPAAVLASLAACLCLAGCDKVPTFDELVHGKKKEAPATSSPQPAARTDTPALPPKAAEPPKKTPQEIIADFNSTPSQKRTDQQVVDLASIPEGRDQFTDMNLAYSGVTDRGLAELPKFERIEKLNIDGCQYKSDAMANVAKLKGLNTLSMYGGAAKDSNGSDKALGHIKDMHQLTSLSVQKANFSAEGLNQLAEMSWLESLNVAQTKFSDDNLRACSGLVNLRELNISRTPLTDPGFLGLLPFTRLEVLRMSGLCDQYGIFQGPGLKELTKKHGLSSLRMLYLDNNPRLLDAGWEGVYNLRRTLEYLDAGDAGVTDSRFSKAIAQCTKLETLLLHKNGDLTDFGMAGAGSASGVTKLRSLKRLFFHDNPGITDRSLKLFARLRSLEGLTLEATHCTLPGVTTLKKQLKDCEITFNSKKIEAD